MATCEEYIVRGNLIYTESMEKFSALSDGGMVVRDGRIQSAGPYGEVADRGLPVLDYRDKLIIPGFVDLHVHAAQYHQIGMGMDETLIRWLEKYTFAEEERFADPERAAVLYADFVRELVYSGTTRAAVFATTHPVATDILCRLLKKAGVGAFVGKVNMDANAPAELQEETKTSLEQTRQFLRQWQDDPLIRPILTPRFAPSVTRELLAGLGELGREYQVPVQSHLAENQEEVAWVARLFPERASYLDVYDYYHLFGDTPTLMAHCIYLSPQDIRYMAGRNVYAVHCPDSNLNLRSGLMPARKMLRAGVRMGLGSDVGAGNSLFMPHEIVRAIEISKIYALHHPEDDPLHLSEAFYLATKGGGSFFGQVGSLEPGYAADFLVVDVGAHQGKRSLEEQLEFFLYHGSPHNICARYAAGRSLDMSTF